MNDWELIQAYCRNGSESAFETLVKRHVDFVYCSALRQVRDPLLAEDVSQAVFLLLFRKAKSFRSGTVLVSWLFRTTRFVGARALRTECRRQRVASSRLVARRFAAPAVRDQAIETVPAGGPNSLPSHTTSNGASGWIRPASGWLGSMR